MEKLLLEKFSIPISFVKESQETEKADFFIQGVAINETITRNGIKYEAKELEKSAKTLMNKPMLKDHENRVDNIVGRVKESWFDNSKKALMFKAQVMDKEIQEKIADGRLTNVSIGASVMDLVKTEKDGEDFLIARGLEFLELSFTPVPGDPNAEFSMVLNEAFNKHILTENKGEEKMTEIIEKENTRMAELEAQLKEKEKLIDEQKAVLEKIEKERIEKKIAEYKELCEKKKVSVQEISDENTLNILIKTLSELAEEEEEEADEEEEVQEKVTKSKLVKEEKEEENENYVLERTENKYGIYKVN